MIVDSSAALFVVYDVVNCRPAELFFDLLQQLLLKLKAAQHKPLTKSDVCKTD